MIYVRKTKDMLSARILLEMRIHRGWENTIHIMPSNQRRPSAVTLPNGQQPVSNP
jgi:hypothetical protein